MSDELACLPSADQAEAWPRVSAMLEGYRLAAMKALRGELAPGRKKRAAGSRKLNAWIRENGLSNEDAR